MNTIEAINQCLRNTRVESLSEVSVTDAEILVRALNEGIQDYFDLVPAAHRRTTMSHLLKAPETVSGIVLAQGETVMTSGEPFTTEMRGCSIVLDGDPIPNEVVDVDTVLRPYTGSTATPFTGYLYWDAVPITDFAIERITSDLRIKTRSLAQRVLQRANPGQHYQQGWAQNEDTWWGTIGGSDGLPEWYRVDYVGGSVQNENDALVVLRVAPRPTEMVVVEFEADVRPLAYAVTALQDAREIPVSRTRANHLLPLIEAHLVGTPVWIGSDMATKRVLEREQDARRKCAIMTTDFAVPHHRAGTPYGW